VSLRDFYPKALSSFKPGWSYTELKENAADLVNLADPFSTDIQITHLGGVANEKRIMMFGADGVGKTAILYKLKLGDDILTTPTIGFNVETIPYRDANFTIWDLGGHESIRTLWKHYTQNVDGSIIVINGSGDIDSQKDIISNFLNEVNDLKTKPILVYVNKKDISQYQLFEVEQAFDSIRFSCSNIKFILSSSKTGEGLYEGLAFLFSALSSVVNE